MTSRKTHLTAGLALFVLVAATGPAAAEDAAENHELTAKVVAVDLAAKSIRVETGTGPSQVFFAVGKAAEHLDELPAGQVFKLTVRDSDDGKRHEVVAIKRVKSSSKP